MTEQEIDNRFVYHPPFGDQPRRYEAIRVHCRNTATVLTKLCPPSDELTAAINRIEEACMWANASIARNERKADADEV